MRVEDNKKCPSERRRMVEGYMKIKAFYLTDLATGWKQLTGDGDGDAFAIFDVWIVGDFLQLVEKGTKLVLEQVVTTIASVADTSEEQFVAYYDRLMPCLKYIISNANTEDLKMLRGKAIECVSLIGLAVGAEKFMRDASEVMDMLLKTQTEGGDLPDDDPQTSYLISAWARICKILGKQFEQYLPLVMGPVMKAASMKPEVALLDNDDMQGVEGDLDWQFVSLGEQQNFGIKTSGNFEIT
uniref:Importin subunit beta-1/Transportin-1-like TPR repeats domain-containing protein n=1 Tax=Timema tahoe TaxID=61484 RepID=A0A7R9FKW4_9NEOP|nr:unnamed protein product [Timema tahoe]